MTDEEYVKVMYQLNERVGEEILPLLDDLEEEYPEHSAFFTAFISTMHVLFEQGWTREELLGEVTEHHDIFLKNEAGELN